MSRDPFEHLRESNPLPDDQPVYAPMSAADRITGGGPRRSWPAWALAGGLALAVLTGGGAWMLWARGGTQDIVATSTAPTTEAVSTTGVPTFPEDDAVVYFFVEDVGPHQPRDPFLIPAARPYGVLSHMVEDPVYETLNFLLIGTAPGEEEADPALISYIPEETRLLGVEVADGIATVDLSAEFASDGDSDAALRPRLAQVVFTLTRFDDISGVRFLIDGLPSANLDAAMAGDPATRADFADLLPAVMIESPIYWASSGDNPLVVTGTVDGYAVVWLQLLDQNGAVLWESPPATETTTPSGSFSVEIPYRVAEAQLGTLVAGDISMVDRADANPQRRPVWLNASPGATTTTNPIDAQLALRYDLDKALDAYLEELAAIDAQLVGLPLDQGAELRTRAAELDQQVGEVRDGLSRVFDELRRLGADFAIPCSADELGSELLGQPDLPAAVADLRTTVYEATRACDWEALRGLLDEGAFSYSFGEDGDPIGFWQREEFLHYQPMLYIADMLQRPFGVVESDGLPIYAWPSAHTYGSWDAVPEAEKEALRPLYDDLDFGFFGEFGGYLGYRIGITLDGDWAQWIYAIDGD
jgi:hypothetical protein